eukprot:189112-Amphidinium_carterae.2
MSAQSQRKSEDSSQTRAPVVIQSLDWQTYIKWEPPHTHQQGSHQIKKCPKAHAVTETLCGSTQERKRHSIRSQWQASERQDEFSGLPQLMSRYHTRPRPDLALQKDDVKPTPGDNIQPEESAAAQPAAAAASSSASSSPPSSSSSSGAASSSDQPRACRDAHSIRLTSHQATSRTGGSASQVQTQDRYNIQWSRVNAEDQSQGAKRSSDTAPEDLQAQSGAASQERFNAME